MTSLLFNPLAPRGLGIEYRYINLITESGLFNSKIPRP